MCPSLGAGRASIWHCDRVLINRRHRPLPLLLLRRRAPHVERAKRTTTRGRLSRRLGASTTKKLIGGSLFTPDFVQSDLLLLRCSLQSYCFLVWGAHLGPLWIEGILEEKQRIPNPIWNDTVHPFGTKDSSIGEMEGYFL
jgi:hypothetical protein